MKLSFSISRRLIVPTVAALAVSLGAIAYASIPDAGVIHGCYHKNTGQLRVIEADGSCLPAELPLDWEAGPAAPAGRVAQSAGDSTIPGFSLGESQTVTITAPSAGYVLVQAWVTINPLTANPGFVGAQLRDDATGSTSNVQVMGLAGPLPLPLAIGWTFGVPAAGEYTYALDLGGTGASFAFNPSSKTLTALFVPGGPNG